MVDDRLEPVFDMTAKKKKKKRRRAFVDERLEAGAGAAAAAAAEATAGGWVGHEYAEMLEMVYSRLRDRQATTGRGILTDGSGARRFVVTPPQVIKLGSKKSGFINFETIAAELGRAPDHLRRYLLVELGTSGTTDGIGTLTLKGKFGRGDVEGVLTRYIREFVRCPQCRSCSTDLNRNKARRTMFIACRDCTAETMVGAVEGGYTALTEKRSRVRRREGM